MKPRPVTDIEQLQNELSGRLLELSVLYETSYSLGHSLNYYQIVTVIMDAIFKVLQVDISAVLLLGFTRSGAGELLVRLNHPVEEPLIKSVQQNVMTTVTPFLNEPINQSQISFATEKHFMPLHGSVKPVSNLTSFMNVPLVFKDEVMGLLHISTQHVDAFHQNEMTFFHTMANQMASHLGRLKVLRELEKTKIGSMISSMTEGVIMLDENNHLEMINSSGKRLLGFDEDSMLSAKDLINRFTELQLIDLYYNSLINGESILNHELSYQDKIILVNITPVLNDEKKRIGMVMVLRDVTEIQKINRINSQRLSAISQVSDVISSISDLDRLLTVLMELILEVLGAQMGSIQLLEKGEFHTRVHSNFPDKIRLQYRFKSGETLSRYVLKTKEACVIQDYAQDPLMSHHTKIAIHSYVCTPIIVKNDLIGVINIVRKPGKNIPPITSDDLETLKTITAICGTAIQNATLFQDTLKKEVIDQELSVAYDIQKRLLPSKLPEFSNMNFGALSIPARAIGGDYYDFFDLADGKLGIVIADIIGKGIPAALFMAMLKSILQSHIRHTSGPKQLMENMNTFLLADPVFNKFVPIFYIVLDPKTNEATYCNAGHEPALLLSNDHFVSLDTGGLPLGADADSIFEEKTVTLNPNDLICLFTDGIIEARNKRETEFRHARLKAAIKRYGTEDGAKLVQSIYQELYDFMDGHEQHDDLTLVAIQMSPRAATQSEKVIHESHISVKSTKAEIAIVRKAIEDAAMVMVFPEEAVFDIKLAVNEAQANIIEHAYQGKTTGQIDVTIRGYPNRMEIVLKDYGTGAKQHTIKGENHLDELEGSGLGVFLIHQLMDEVFYTHQSNLGSELFMIKKRESKKEK